MKSKVHDYYKGKQDAMSKCLCDQGGSSGRFILPVGFQLTNSAVVSGESIVTM